MKKIVQVVTISILYLHLSFYAIGINMPGKPAYGNTQLKPTPSPLTGFHTLKKRWGPDITLGLQIGPVFSKIKGPDVEDVKMIMSSVEGGFIQFHTVSEIHYQLGLNYSPQGFKKKTTYLNELGQTVTDDFSVHLDYVKIPALMGISFGEKFIINIDAGLYLSFLTRANQKGTQKIESEGFDPVSMQVNIDLKESYKKSDLGFLFGGGVQYPLTEKRSGTNISVFANALMQMSLKNISRLADIEFKNRNYQLTIGVLFHLDQ